MMMPRRLFLSVLAAVLVVVAGWRALSWLWPPVSPVAGATATISVDAGQRFQTMTGWEVSARSWEMDKVANRFDGSWLDFRDEIIAVLADEAGINRIRLQVRSGAENPVDYWGRFMKGEITYKEVKAHFYEKINDNADPARADAAGFQFSHIDYQVENMLLPLQRRLAARGERLFINLCYVDFRGGLSGDLSHARDPAEYAELIDETFRHLKTRWGVVPDTLEIVLEPDNTEAWGGREIGEGAVAALARLHEDGFAPRLILPSTAAAENAPSYFDEALRVPGVAEHLFSLSYHRYDGRNAAKAFDAIRARAAAHGIPSEMLEYTTGSYRDLHEDLTKVSAAGWQLYSIAAPRTPGQKGPSLSVLVYVERGGPEGPRVFLSDQGRYLAQYFRHVRIGAERIGAVSSDPAFAPVAFLNTDGTEVVVIAAESGGMVTVEGLPPGRYGVSYTTEAETGRAMPPVDLATGATLSTAIPAAGVLTIHPVGRT
jgi:hypothetical protein